MLANPTMSLAVQGALNAPSAYISRFVFVPTQATGASSAPGEGNNWRATAYRVNRNAHRSLGTRSLARGEFQQAVPLPMTLEDYEIVAKEYAVAHPIDLSKKGGLDAFGLANYEEIVANHLAEALRIDEEIRAASKIKDTGVFSQGADLTSAPWTSDTTEPIEQMQTGVNTIMRAGLTPNRIVFSKNYWDAFTRHPQVKELFGLNELRPNRARVASLLSEVLLGHVPNVEPLDIRVATATYNSAAEGLSATEEFIFDSSCIILAAPPGLEEGQYANITDLCAAKTYEIKAPTVEYEEARKVGEWTASHVSSPEVYDASLAYVFRNAA